jgi:polygalacturonase
MGWSSWNNFRTGINEEIIRAQADVMRSSAMYEAGYRFINIDDGYFGGRDAEGGLFCDSLKFPSGMKALADYIHGRGLKAGIYTDVGSNTCGSIYDKDVNGIGVGLFGHVEQDCRTFFTDWGYDFLKVDWCGGERQGLDERIEYTRIAKAIRAIRPDAVFNVCRWQFPGEWVTEIADSWRISGDIRESFHSILKIIDLNAELYSYASAGHYNDMDMLQVGRGMTYEEDKTHFSMWCMLSSPLLAGNDLRSMSEETLEILTNREVIALNQDRRFAQARRVFSADGVDLWEKPLADGSKAVAILNRDNREVEFTLHFDSLHVHEKSKVRDLWQHSDWGEAGRERRLTLAPHGIVVLKVENYTPDVFPDGTPVPDWFRENHPVDRSALGKLYRITDYDVVNDSTKLQTERIQAVIDLAHREGGGVVVVPEGTFLSGSLFFKPQTHLHLEEKAVLKGSDDISHFPIVETRIEGQSLRYFAALINVDRVDGFTLSGEGTVDGNGLRYWKAFWLRREFNPNCTNMDEMRPRLVYISNSSDVQLSGVRLVNSPFWTTHLYRCRNVKLLNLYIYSPDRPVKAPSTDAVDIDACSQVLIKNCYMSVNDDAVALKGGKGPEADKNPNNGGNRDIIIEDCTYGFCHSALTCGSEAIHNRNILFRRSTVDRAQRILWLKMRPDTPQNYEYLSVEDVTGNANTVVDINPWTQFFDLKGHDGPILSHASHITMRNVTIDCNTVFNVKRSSQYVLSCFTFENLDITAVNRPNIPSSFIDGFILDNVRINGEIVDSGETRD